MKKPICVIVGVGPGNGAAISHLFAEMNHTVVLLARNKDFTGKLAAELNNSYAYECDVTDAKSISAIFNRINADIGEIDVLIYNAGSGVFGNIDEITPAQFETAWRVNALGLLLTSQQVIPAMKQKKHGNIIVIGATSSRRGNIKTAAFAPAKAAQRSLAESMAKYLWPHHIHVAVVIIDGVVDLPRTREQLSNKPDSFFVKPADVAKTVYWLTEQPSSAWTFEVEARPFGEVW